MKLRTFSTGAAAAIATALLTGVAFAAANVADTTDNDDADHGTAVATLAKTTTASGQAKGVAISTAAKARDAAADTDAADTDVKETDETDADATDADSHGDTISALAKNTEAGPEHGPTVSAAARTGSTATRNDGKGSTTSTDARTGHGSR